MPGSIKIDDGSGNYTILTNAGSLGSDKTITIPNETGTLNLQSGSVLQVVNATDVSTDNGSSQYGVQISSTSFTDTGLTATITPSATSSKIMIFVSGVGGNDASHTRVTTGLHRDSTLVKECSFYTVQDDALVPITWSYLDSPSSTSQITYALKFKSDNSGGTVTLNRAFNNSTDFGTTMITAVEVLA